MTQLILVVEDDPAVQHAIVRNLSVRGYRAVGASSVSDALRELEAEAPRLVILDVDLPDGSGWDVLRALRASGGNSVRAIVMSAMRPNHRLVTELQCYGFLEKPFPMDALRRLVSESIGPPLGDEPAETTAESNSK